MSIYNFYNPPKAKKSLLALHKEVFKEVYDFYKTDSYSDLLKQNGTDWDLSMAKRLNLMKKISNNMRWNLSRDSLKTLQANGKLSGIEYC